MSRLIFLTAILFPSVATAQFFEPTYVAQGSYYGLCIDDPQSCEGLCDGEYLESYDFAPFHANWERRFRCLGLRGAVRASMWSRVTGTEIVCYMRSVSDVSVEQIVPNGRTESSLTSVYWLDFDVPAPVRVRMRATVQLDFNAVIEPGHQDTAHVWIWSPWDDLERDLWDSSDPLEFDAEGTLSAGSHALIMFIYDATLQQNAAVQTGAEHIDALAWFRMNVVLCPGDVDYDNAVALSDLNVLLAHLGGLGARAEGDLDGDGLVDFTDLTQMLSLFGSTCTW